GDGGQFGPVAGQILTAHETPGAFDVVSWNGTAFVTTPVSFTGVTSGLAWEQVAFLPAGLGPVQPPEPGLPNWQIYLDTNNNGVLDAGEPSTLTDANGNYSFTGLQPGTYVVREVPQTGWTQTRPAAPGSYTEAVVGGQAISGVDFGNQLTGTPS